MAIHRGIQSAIFYYLSCAPCADARYRKQRTQESARGRIERQLYEADNPHLYRQPSPSSTNPHWQAEIDRGPALASRRKRKPASTNDQRAGRSMGNNGSAEPSSIDLAERPPSPDGDDSRWNFRLYQREDEELWGTSINLDGTSQYGSLPRPQRALTRDSTSSTHQSFRNPPINDMHPATVTRINSREQVMWMLQPPPVADVMKGKERVGRSRSDSGGSRLKSSSNVTLSRQLSHHSAQKRSNPADLAPQMFRESPSNDPVGQGHDGSAMTSERDFVTSPTSFEKENHRLSTMHVPHENQASNNTIIQRLPSLEPMSEAAPRRVSSRPQLSTIVSEDGMTASASSAPENVLENDPPTPPPSSDKDTDLRRPSTRLSTFVVDGDPRRVTDDMTPRSLNRTFIRTHTTPDLQTGNARPVGHKHIDSELGIKPELFDSWYMPEFELPKWVAEHTKREVKQRWSMDL